MKKIASVMASAVFATSLLLPSIASAKVYTKVETLEYLLNYFVYNSYDLTTDCDFDYSLDELRLAVNSAYTDGSVDDATVRFLGHKYKGLTGELTKKNDTYYLLTLKGPKSALNKEYGRITYKAKIKRRAIEDIYHGTVTIKRNQSSNFSACSADSTF